MGAIDGQGPDAARRRRVLAALGVAAAAPVALGADALAQVQGEGRNNKKKRRNKRKKDKKGDIAILNYALTLEHLEYAFYRDGLETYDADAFAAEGYASNVFDYFAMIRDDEKAHVDTITQVITDLGGEPVAEAMYDFGYSDLESFIDVAKALENTGVSAYQGAAKDLIGENELLTAALTIHGVEARHAAYLNGLTGESPFPDAFNPTLTPDEVLAIAGPFIKM